MLGTPLVKSIVSNETSRLGKLGCTDKPPWMEKQNKNVGQQFDMTENVSNSNNH
jgi:hypothetical protein